MKRGINYIGVGVGAVIIDKQHRIFLAQRGKQAQNEAGKWECPGGSVEFGDTLASTLIREIQEEYGIVIRVEELLDVADHLIPQEKQHWVSPSFICRIKKGKPMIKEPSKCMDIGWFSLAQEEKLPLSITAKINFKALKKRYGKTLKKLRTV